MKHLLSRLFLLLTVFAMILTLVGCSAHADVNGGSAAVDADLIDLSLFAGQIEKQIHIKERCKCAGAEHDGTVVGGCGSHCYNKSEEGHAHLIGDHLAYDCAVCGICVYHLHLPHGVYSLYAPF